MTAPALVELSTEAGAGLGHTMVMGRHHLSQLDLFTDDALSAVLDSYPEERLHILTMGLDPERSADNERVERGGASGAELLESVRRGRLWLNITGIDEVDRRYRTLVDGLYEEVGRQAPGFSSVETHATLLVSSPGAMVYFHVDGPPSFLWHIRGRKRLWVYPALDETLVSRQHLEDVFAGVRQEYMPYQRSFDQYAQEFDLEPGQVAMWPQNAPHRITNLDSLNVSLVTDHYTPQARKRARAYRANRFLRSRLHVPGTWLSTRDRGPLATAKLAVQQAGRRLGMEAPTSKAHRPAVRRIDPTAPDGLSAL